MFLKRFLDFVVSFLGLIILIPMIILISALIIITSGTPIFFIQKRVGKNGSLYKMKKFRTMVNGANQLTGGSITIKNDLRITSIGRFLRKWKLDELPTLWNVLIGDMSLVGPRPDVPGYADNLNGVDRRILELRPGITGPATLKYANEEQLLENVEDPIKYNDEVIFPDKVKINLKYMDNWSFWLDIKIIVKTIFRRNY